jgi:hypothetical protein
LSEAPGRAGRNNLLVSGRRVAAITLLVIAVATGAWAWFLAGRGLEDMDRWSSVLAGLVGLAFGIAAVVLGVLSLRGRGAPTGGAGVSVGGDVTGAIVTGDHNEVRVRDDQ